MNDRRKGERRKRHYLPGVEEGFVFLPHIGNWVAPADQRRGERRVKELNMESIHIKLRPPAMTAEEANRALDESKPYGECDYQWYAPHILPGGNLEHVREKCARAYGHSGQHLSNRKVTSSETEK